MDLIVLVNKAQHGDEKAVQEICGRFAGLVKKYAFQPHVRSFADDAESQGWLEVVRGIQEYNEQSGVHFAGYIESRVRYGIWNLFKRERRRWENEGQLDGGETEADGIAKLEKLIDSSNVENEVEAKWLADELRELISMLPAKQRMVICRTIIGNEQLVILATELGITSQGVYNLRKRGLSSLKKACVGMYLDIRL